MVNIIGKKIKLNNGMTGTVFCKMYGGPNDGKYYLKIENTNKIYIFSEDEIKHD